MSKLILFDIDGTLVKSHQGHYEAFAVAFKEVFGVYGSMYMVDYHGKSDQWIVREVMRSCGIPDDVIDAKIQECMKVMGEYYTAVGPSLTTALFDGVQATLQALQSDDYILGLVTGNVEAIAHMKLGRANIDSFFTLGGFGNESPERFELVQSAITKAIKQYGFKLDNNVYVIGDTPNDIDAALKAGVIGIGVTTGVYGADELKQAGAHKVIDSVANTSALIDAIS